MPGMGTHSFAHSRQAGRGQSAKHSVLLEPVKAGYLEGLITRFTERQFFSVHGFNLEVTVQSSGPVFIQFLCRSIVTSLGICLSIILHAASARREA